MKDGHIVNSTANPGTGIMVSHLKFNTHMGPILEGSILIESLSGEKLII